MHENPIILSKEQWQELRQRLLHPEIPKPSFNPRITITKIKNGMEVNIPNLDLSFIDQMEGTNHEHHD